MKRRPLLWLSLTLGGCHFLASLLIVPLTLWTGDVIWTGAAKSTLMGVLHSLTRVFYYPILSHALYPRHWFPGSWVTVPILVNSLLCGWLLGCIAHGVWRIRSIR